MVANNQRGRHQGEQLVAVLHHGKMPCECPLCAKSRHCDAELVRYASAISASRRLRSLRPEGNPTGRNEAFTMQRLPLASLYRDNRWHQLLLWIPNRLQEKPLEVGRCARLFLCSRQISHEGVGAIS